jgi:hypothetical protein
MGIVEQAACEPSSLSPQRHSLSVWWKLVARLAPAYAYALTSFCNWALGRPPIGEPTGPFRRADISDSTDEMSAEADDASNTFVGERSLPGAEPMFECPPESAVEWPLVAEVV